MQFHQHHTRRRTNIEFHRRLRLETSFLSGIHSVLTLQQCGVNGGHGQAPATVEVGNRGRDFGLRDEILAASMLVIEGGWLPPAAGGSSRKSSRKVDLGAVLLGRADNGC